MTEFPGCLLTVTAEVNPEVEAEWNRWYDTVHLPDALKCPGVRHGCRYVSSGEISETSGGKTEKIAKRIYTTIYEIDGPFFFGAAETFKQTIAVLARPPRVLVLRMRKVGLLDATGLALLRDLAHKGNAGGSTLVLSEVQAQPMKALKDARLLEVIGIDNCAADIEMAIARAYTLLSDDGRAPRA